jgi:hypothetical protein
MLVLGACDPKGRGVKHGGPPVAARSFHHRPEVIAGALETDLPGYEGSSDQFVDVDLPSKPISTLTALIPISATA